MLKTNISCWSHIFLGIINKFYQRNIMRISLLKSSKLIKFLDWKSPKSDTLMQCKRLIFVKINDTIVKKQRHIPQIPVQELYNDMILSISEVFLGARTVDGKVCIGDTSPSKYMPKYITPVRNRNNIACGC